ncbi:hypothetical protein [Cellulomonas sp. PhB150]|uniref:hypothetical protein n=1 Tax=Cellulomonas sp. PhB150 TaxID=2485188 RepID=UPI000F468597|nr:hypothetical protein [Cellulomonas sp. PhB150]ROS28256.1 hypothetical protein EDF34_2058 [Cellulomonas sp. PhB150]
MTLRRRRPGEQIRVPRSAWEVAEEAHELLTHAGEPVGPGLTADEREAVEERFGFRFAPVHRAFLALGLPRGPQWPSWRSGSARVLRARLRLPVDGVVADVLEHDLWPARWGPRPTDLAEREAVARDELAGVPVLVPLFGQRYLPADDPLPTLPVLSVHRSEVLVSGRSLVEFIGREFSMDLNPSDADARSAARVPFWTDLSEVVEATRLGRGIMSP